MNGGRNGGVSMAAGASRVCSWVTVLLSSILYRVICCPLLAALEEFWGCVVQPELLEVSSRGRFHLADLR